MKTKTKFWILSLTSIVFFLFLFALSVHSAESTFIIGTSYKSLLSEPDQSGMLDRIAKEAFGRLGITVDLPFLPAERSIMAANAGVHDGELNRVEGLERMYTHLIRVPESNMDFNFVVFSKQGDIANTDWSTLKSLRVGFIKGWKILEDQLKDHPEIVYANSAEQLFTQLDKDHIDVALYGELIGYAQLRKMGLKDIKVLTPPLTTKKMYMYLNEKHKQLIPKVADSLREMKRDGTYDRIVKETTGPYLIGSENQ